MQDKPATALYQSLGYEVIKQDCVLWKLLGQDRRYVAGLTLIQPPHPQMLVRCSLEQAHCTLTLSDCNLVRYAGTSCVRRCLLTSCQMSGQSQTQGCRVTERSQSDCLAFRHGPGHALCCAS